MSAIKLIEINYSSKTLNSLINMLIIVNYNFNNKRFKINLVIKIMLIKIINFYNNLVKIILNKTIFNKIINS